MVEPMEMGPYGRGMEREAGGLPERKRENFREAQQTLPPATWRKNQAGIVSGRTAGCKPAVSS